MSEKPRGVPWKRPRSVAAAAAAAALVAGGGCVGPLAERPSDFGERLDPARFKRVSGFDPAPAAREPETPQETAARALSAFEGLAELPMTLDEARASAIEHNLDLSVALVDPLIAGESLRVERAKFESVFRVSGRYNEDDSPTFNTTQSSQQDSLQVSTGVDVPLRTGGRASVDLIEQWRETSNPFVTLSTSYDAALQFSFSQPLLRNAGRRVNTHSIRVASYEEQAAMSRTKLEVIRQLAAVDRTYWRLYAARRALEVTQQQYELALAQLARARRRVDAGDAAEIEIVRAEAGLAERLEAIIIAENSVLREQRTLKRVINQPGLGLGTTVMVVPATEPEVTPYTFDGAALAETAEAGRMEMLELELLLAADASTIDFQRNQALPLLSLDYQYRIGALSDTFRGVQNELWQNDFESWSLGLSAEIPIGNEAAKARVDRAIYSRLRRLATRESRRLSIRQEVFDAVDAVESGWRRIMAARQSVVAEARNYQAEERQFQVGARTSTDVLDAAARLAESQLSEIRALADYQIALIDLAFATGTLLGRAEIDWEPALPALGPVERAPLRASEQSPR